MIRIAHLSDLHVRGSWAKDQQVIVDAFLKDIEDFKNEHPFDLVIFTGDLTFCATDDQFQAAATNFLDRLECQLGLRREQMIVAPGNHDIDAGRIHTFQEAGMRVSLTDRGEVNKLLDNTKDLADSTSRSEAWFQFHSSYYASCPPIASEPLAHVHRLELNGSRVAVAVLHSAWRATGRPEGVDKNNMLVGERQIANTVAHLADADICLVAMHHPLDWLADFDAADVRRLISTHFDILLTGHTHINEPAGLNLPAGGYLHSAAGALYQTREYLNSYSILDIDLTNWTAQFHLRTFQPGRQEFDAAVDVARNGRLEFNLADSSRRLSAVATARSSTDVEKTTTRRILESLRDRSVLVPLVSDGTNALDHFVVPPVFLPLPYEQFVVARDNNGARPDYVDVLSSLDSTRCVVVVGAEGSGLTTTLSWLALREHTRRPGLTPLVVNAGDFQQGHDPVKKAAFRSLVSAGVAVDPKAALPPLILAIDDVSLISKQTAERVAKHINEHSSNVYLIGCRPNSERTLAAVLDSMGVEYQKCHLGPFGRKQMRALVERMDIDQGEQVLNTIERLVLREGMSRTPFNMATLISVLAANENFAVQGNETAVLSEYVSLLLEQHDPGGDARLSMDSRDREHLLGSFAEELLKAGVDSMSRADVEAFLSGYFSKVGWSEAATQVLNALIRRKVLFEDPDRMIAFWQPPLLPLFAAKRFIDDSNFREMILANPIPHSDVIRHAAYLKRNDRALLEHAGGLLLSESGEPVAGELFELTADEEGWSANEEDEPNGDNEESDKDSTHEMAMDVEDSHGPQLKDDGDAEDDPDDDDEEAIDAKMDEMFEEFAEARRKSSIARRQTDEEELKPLRRMERTLKLVSSVLRNSELVDGADLKREVLKQTLARWADFSALVAAQGTPDDVRSVLVQLEIDGDIEDVTSKVTVMGPVIYSRILMESSLSNRRLERPLRALLDDAGFVQLPGPALMACLLGSHMRIQRWTDDLLRLVQAHGHRRVIAEIAAFVCMDSVFHENVYSAREKQGLEDVLVEVFTHNTKFESQRDRSEAMASMRQMIRRNSIATSFLQRASGIDAD